MSRKSRKNGQMLVAVMMMVTTVIIMFGMTVSIGHLVQSKINLQNSIDLSAMSAASAQARHMNTLSVANYRIRALLKFFLLDAYVTQTRFSENFQNQIAGSTSDAPIQTPLTTLIVCEIGRGFRATLPGETSVSETGDPCFHAGTNKKITPVISSPFLGIDPAYIAINLRLMKVKRQFAAECDSWRDSNAVWVDWALNRVQDNTDEATKVFEEQTQFFAEDLGNGSPFLKGPGGLAAKNTFYSNLLGSTYAATPSDQAILFLNKASERSLKYADDFVPIQKSIGLPYIRSINDDGCSILPNPSGARGTARPIITGVARKSSKVVQVALLASAVNSKILFWPQGLEPTLVAVAAAKPFGSRIGPPKSYLDAESAAGSGYGNVTLFPGDDARDITTGGVGRKGFLGYAFRNTLPAPGSAVPQLRPKGTGDRAELQQFAFSPSIFDSLYFSIFDYANEDSDFYGPDNRFDTEIITKGMDDRGSSMPDPYVWLANLPTDQGMSKYFNKEAVTSAWSPDTEKRSGYQIKLLSIESACENSQNNSSEEPTLINLCNTGQATL